MLSDALPLHRVGTGPVTQLDLNTVAKKPATDAPSTVASVQRGISGRIPAILTTVSNKQCYPAFAVVSQHLPFCHCLQISWSHMELWLQRTFVSM